MKSSLPPQQYRYVFALGSIFALRMIGLFMILPVFSLYAHELNGYTPTLLGIALGIYGLTQACLQTPLGFASDRVGRKPIITLGLSLFALGSIIAALSHSMMGIIIGRALQGSGAIGSTLIATVADLTDDQHRTQSMALIGMMIGCSFAGAMVLGPFLSNYFSLAGLFWLTSSFAFCGMLILYYLPIPETNFQDQKNSWSDQFTSVLKNPALLRLDLGIFIQHAILTASFVVFPIMLTHQLFVPLHHQWMLYLPVLVFSFLAAIPFIIIAEKKQLMQPVFLGSIAVTLISQLLLSQTYLSFYILIMSLFLFFTAFTILEACLPSLVSKTVPPHAKGTAMGIYSTSQFLGIFAGGAIGGWFYGHHHLTAVFYACALLAGLWFFFSLSLPIKKPLTNT